MEKTSQDVKGLRVKTEIIRRYYVEDGHGWIYAGPYDTKEEAKTELQIARKIDKEHPIQ